MLGHRAKRRIKDATVRTITGGRGVVVPGNMILTAASCLRVATAAIIDLPEQALQEIELGGKPVKAQISVLEPVQDIAVLGAPDPEILGNEYNLFQNAIRPITPIEIRTEDLELSETLPVEVLTQKGIWITGEVQMGDEGGASLSITTMTEIDGGTSGDPVVDQKGRLVGVVSTFGFNAGALSSPHLALPVWILNDILDCQCLSALPSCEKIWTAWV